MPAKFVTEKIPDNIKDKVFFNGFYLVEVIKVTGSNTIQVKVMHSNVFVEIGSRMVQKQLPEAQPQPEKPV